jgi:hypothetical protein
MRTKRSTRYLQSEPNQGGSNKGASDVGFTELALAVLYRAIKDMHDDSPQCDDRTKAVVFLASNRAALWLDVAGIEQTSMLLALGWDTYAQAVLDNPRARANGPQRRVLEQGIVALTERRG